MKNLHNTYMSLIIIMLISLFTTFSTPKAYLNLPITDDTANTVYLKEDFPSNNNNNNNTNTLPHHFRKISYNLTKDNTQNINLTGLDTLNISGSGEFSDFNLDLLINSINTNCPITVIDLRQESHGFINGIAVSWMNERNNANIGLTLSEILMTEDNKLSSVELNTPFIFHNTNVTVTPTTVSTECNLTKNHDLSYTRIPVTDGHLPSSEMTNYFVKFIKNQPNNTWFHFHCKEGIGRTTTFMIMYDIMNNGNEVSLDDIITRQVVLSTMDEKTANSFFAGDRYVFLNNFFNKYKGIFLL